ncbi:hypothetical protein V3390_00085 [Luteimonas sp. FXH3W]|uniref:Tail protein n=1 Tax=Aquilutibacter rugosus TaxID=3115820 RepID=A0ABU7UVM5_9GAMM
MPVYGKFAAAPIGAGLVARDGGVTLATNADGIGLNRVARSDVSVTTGVRGAGFAFWGDASLVAAVGIIQTGGSLTAVLGSAADSIGWRVDAGVVTQGNSTLRSGLPLVVKGDTVGIRINISAGTIELYRNGALIATLSVILTGFSWHFACSLSAPLSGQLFAAVNSGQWPASNAAELAGWQANPIVPAAVYLADREFITAATDTPPHLRYEGILDSDDITLAQGVTFWPWSNEQASHAAGGAICRVFDPRGQLDALVTADSGSMPVAIVIAAPGSTRAAATVAARFRLDSVEVESETVKVLHLTDADEALDTPVARGVFAPNVPAQAWKVQPAIIGAVANVPGLSCTADGSTQFVADSRVTVTSVRDRGDLMENGTWVADASGQQLMFVSPPQNPVTCDASSLGAGPQAATLAQALTDLMQRANSAAWSLADAQSIDAATGYGVGYYSADATSVGKAIDTVLSSFTAARYRGADGVLRLVRLIDPETVADASLVFDVDDFEGDLLRDPDTAPGLTRTLNFRPNAKVLAESDLVTDYVDVPQSLRDRLTATHQGRVYSPVTVSRMYDRIAAADAFNSVFWAESHARAELDRVLALYAVNRYFYRGTFAWTSAVPPQPGQVGRVRFVDSQGAAQARKILVRSCVFDPVKGTVDIVGWGA